MPNTNINTKSIALPTQVSSKIIQKVQEGSTVMSLAQSMALPGLGTTIPVITGDPEAEWVAETNRKPVSKPSLETRTMQPYTLAVIVPFSNQFKNNMPGLYKAIVERLPKALANKFDKTVFHGAAPGSNFDTFAGCTAQSFGSDAYGALVAADTDIAEHNGIANGYVISPKAKSMLLTSVDGNKRPLFINSVAEGAIPMILGNPTKQSKSVYKAVAEGKDVIGITGDWTQAIYGVTQALNLSISDQATLVDGDETINLWQQNMFAVRAEIEVGFIAEKSCFNLLTV